MKDAFCYTSLQPCLCPNDSESAIWYRGLIPFIPECQLREKLLKQCLKWHLAALRRSLWRRR